MIDRAAAGERQRLTTCVESDLVVGVRQPVSAEPVDVRIRALAERVERTKVAGGRLLDVLALDEHRRHQISYVRSEPRVGNAVSVATFARFTVLAPDAEVALLLSGSGDSKCVDVPVTVELVRCEELVADLVRLAYRAPVSDVEASATPGTQTTFVGPDRKAAGVPSTLVHQWHASDGALHAWAYDLFAGRTERDWVGRKPMVIKHARPALYTKHLRKRLARRSP